MTAPTVQYAVAAILVSDLGDRPTTVPEGTQCYVTGTASLYRMTNGTWTQINATLATPTLYAWRERQHFAYANSTTMASVGFASSPGSTGTQASADDSDGANHSNTTGAVSGNTAGLTGLATTNPFRARDGTPRVIQRIKTGSSIADVRLWVGMATGTITGSATPAESYACFRYDTGADGTAFWRFVTDNASGSPTVTTTTVAIATSTLYDIRIEADASEIRGYINDVLAATHTTTLPAATTLVGWQAVLTTLAASAKVFKWYRTAVLQK